MAGAGDDTLIATRRFYSLIAVSELIEEIT
jgi:hypothetical protein